jgi:hypothetical protein
MAPIDDGDLPSLTTILTIDHNDFETYRIDGRRRFRIAPDRLPR